MDVVQKTCLSCGWRYEVVRRRHGDYDPRCPNCGEASPTPVRQASETGASMGGTLQVRMVPGRGLGIFAMADIPAKALIERAPVYVLSGDAEDLLDKVYMLPYSGSAQGPFLRHILFPWVNDSVRCLLLGYGSLYNHEPEGKANLRKEPYIDPDSNRRFYDFYTTRDVVAGEELTHTYTDEKLWFRYHRGSS